MIKTNKCENCGATLVKKGGGYCCEYCGSTFVSEGQDPNANSPVSYELPTISDEALIATCFHITSKLALIPVVAFGILWSGTAFFMAASAFGTFGAVGLVPLFMGIFGVVLFSCAAKGISGPRYVKEASKLATKDNWSGCYELLKENYVKRPNDGSLIKQLLLICFYRIKDYEKSKIYLNDIKRVIHRPENDIKLIADYLGVEYTINDTASFIGRNIYNNTNGYNNVTRHNTHTRSSNKSIEIGKIDDVFDVIGAIGTAFNHSRKDDNDN